MSKFRQRHRHSSRGGARLVLGAIVGELLGASVGLVIAPKRHVETPVEIAKPSYSDASDSRDSEDSDPLVTWPLLGAVAGNAIGVGVVGVCEALRRVLSSVEGRDQLRSAATRR